jgi:hypothetical protein
MGSSTKLDKLDLVVCETVFCHEDFVAAFRGDFEFEE